MGCVTCSVSNSDFRTPDGQRRMKSTGRGAPLDGRADDTMSREVESPDRQTVLDEMTACFHAAASIYHPSKFWTHYSAKNRDQLTTGGYEHFKRTVATNYFTWIAGVRDPQFWFLARRTPLASWPIVLRDFFGPPVSDRSRTLVSRPVSHADTIAVALCPSTGQCRTLGTESKNRVWEIPSSIYVHGRLVSQDLANSFLEYRAMAEHVAFHDGLTVCELGAGSGRLGFWLLRCHPGLRYVVIDIPPALDLAQWYLTRCFPAASTWRFQPSDDIGPYLGDIAAAQLVFLLPHQAAQLPAALGGSVCEHLVAPRNAGRANRHVPEAHRSTDFWLCILEAMEAKS